MGLGTLGILLGGGAAILGMSGQQMPINSGLPIIAVGVIYLLMTLLYFLLSLYLVRYAGSIKKVVNFGGSDSRSSLKISGRFLKLIGILTLIMIIFMLVGLIFGVGAALIGGIR